MLLRNIKPQNLEESFSNWEMSFYCTATLSEKFYIRLYVTYFKRIHQLPSVILAFWTNRFSCSNFCLWKPHICFRCAEKHGCFLSCRTTRLVAVLSINGVTEWMSSLPAFRRHMFISATCFQVLETGSYTSQLFLTNGPSCPPTAYSRPFSTPTPVHQTHQV